MSRKWLAERKSDHYYKMAKKLGYRSRASFKLKQLNQRFGFFEDAKRVLDLGAAPGGWLQVVSEEIGEDGIVLGVDLEPISPLGLSNVVTMIGDVTKRETIKQIREKLPGKFDVILSDTAPNISGVWDVDHLRQIDLAGQAIYIARELLKRDGWMVLKVFQGAEYVRFLNEIKNTFEYVRVIKPGASRKVSAETYIVARRMQWRTKKSREVMKKVSTPAP